MNFDFSDEQKLLRQTAREYLDRACAAQRVPRGARVRRARTPRRCGRASPSWVGSATAIPEEYGGAGFGHLELAVIAEELGRALAPIPFSSSIYLAAEAILLAG